jgi:UDP:flavonoid glycosyltransferase YjiC (YdhE family)
MPTILLTAFGSHGDLNPMIALAGSLQRQGARAVIGSSASYQSKVEACGIEFRAIAPDMPDFAKNPDLARRLLDSSKGAEMLVKNFAMTHLRQALSDTLAAAQGVDALVASALSIATPMAAEILGKPWASAVLQPLAYLSPIDAPTLQPAMWLEPTRSWGAAGLLMRQCAYAVGRFKTRSWCTEHARLRTELSLSREPEPLFLTAKSPWLSLAMFSPLLARACDDWPSSCVQSGFCIPKGPSGGSAESMPATLLEFLNRHPHPIVFTLGTAAVHWADDFYSSGRMACEVLGLPAIFLSGLDGQNQMGHLSNTMIRVPYAPHSEIFPLAQAIVHSCGAGTCAQSLRSGRPVLATPWAHDQPDNARRLAALGVARVLPRNNINAQSMRVALQSLLNDPIVADKAASVGRLERSLPDGADVAAHAILKKLAQTDSC